MEKRLAPLVFSLFLLQSCNYERPKKSQSPMKEAFGIEIIINKNYMGFATLKLRGRLHLVENYDLNQDKEVDLVFLRPGKIVEGEGNSRIIYLPNPSEYIFDEDKEGFFDVSYYDPYLDGFNGNEIKSKSRKLTGKFMPKL